MTLNRNFHIAVALIIKEKSSLGTSLEAVSKPPPKPNSGVGSRDLILEIFHVCLRLKLSPFLIFIKIERFSKVSVKRKRTGESRGVPDILPDLKGSDGLYLNMEKKSMKIIR